MRYSTFFECMSPWADAYSQSVASFILFLNITDNEKAVKKGIKYKDIESNDYDNIIPPQRYHKYANDGLEINSLAHKIYNKCNKAKFMNFLKTEASGSILKEKLYNNFFEKRHELQKEHIFENPQNLFIDITDAFLEILEGATKKYKKSPRNNPRNSSNELEDAEDPVNETAFIYDEAIVKSTKEETIDPPIDDSCNAEKEEHESTTPNSVTDNHTEDNSVNINNISNTNIENTSIYSTTNRITHIDNKTIVINIKSKDKDALTSIRALIGNIMVNLDQLKKLGGFINLSYSFSNSGNQNDEKMREYKALKDMFVENNNNLAAFFLTFPELEEMLMHMISLSEEMDFKYSYNKEENDKVVTKITEYEYYIKIVREALLSK